MKGTIHATLDRLTHITEAHNVVVIFRVNEILKTINMEFQKIIYNTFTIMKGKEHSGERANNI